MVRRADENHQYREAKAYEKLVEQPRPGSVIITRRGKQSLKYRSRTKRKRFDVEAAPLTDKMRMQPTSAG